MNRVREFLVAQGIAIEGELPPQIEITEVTEDSRQCVPGSLFVALRGRDHDGHAFIEEAARAGARAAIVMDRLERCPEGMAILKVPDTRRIVGPLAQEVAGRPSWEMDVLGVTGTNGKTTTAYLTEAILRAAARRPALLSTITTRWPGEERPSKETTPSATALARLMRQMRQAGADALAMEVSSHAIDQRRIDGVRFRAAALTNVTQDHLDYHPSMEHYVATKRALFDRMRQTWSGAIGVVNLDDPTGRAIAGALPKANRLTYAIRTSGADLRTEAVFFGEEGTMLQLVHGSSRFTIRTPLPCLFNVQNCLAATGLALAIGLGPEAIDEGCRHFRGAPGRFEMIPADDRFKVIVDYAHTPDALRHLLINARTYVRRRLIVVFGCGGDRDPTKRPKMGRLAGELADELIVTNDNPRREDPEKIVQGILEGVRSAAAGAHCRVILDRREAIVTALNSALEGDVVVIAGKGHEPYQILGDRTVHFDDREVVRQTLGRISPAEIAATQRILPTPGSAA